LQQLGIAIGSSLELQLLAQAAWIGGGGGHS